MGQTKIKYHHVEWEDEKYKLAIPSKGRDIPKQEKINITKVICLMYETDEYSLDECCNSVRISERTLFKWRDEISEISELFNSSDKKKDNIYRYKMQKLGRRMLERLVTGYNVETTEREAEPTTDEAGNPVMKTTKIKRKEIFIRPSVKAIEVVLYNTDGTMYEKNPKPIEKMNKEVDIDPIEWVD